MTGFERLSSIDTIFLDLDGPGSPMQVGAVMILEGPAPSRAELTEHLRRRLARVPRCLQKLAFVPFGLGRPVWVDEPKVDLAWHVQEGRATSEAELEEVAARFFAEALDRGRPLWRLLLVGGLGGGRFALVSKTHHCMLDGVAGVDILHAVTDPTPDAADPAEVDTPPAPPPPEPKHLLQAAVQELLAAPLRLLQGALEPTTDAGRLVRELVAGVKPLAALAAQGPAPRCHLDADVGPGRVWAMPSFALADIKEVRSALGGTVNDVLLALVAAGLRSVLVARGEPFPSELRAFVPVNVRRTEAAGTYGNHVAMMFCPLPVGEADAVARLVRIAAATRHLKESRQPSGAVTLARAGALVPAAVTAEATRALLGLHFFNVVASSVVGPAEPLYLRGRRLLRVHPTLPIARGQSLSLGFFSYCGSVHAGLLAGVERTLELRALARALPEALAELLAAARVRTGRPLAAALAPRPRPLGPSPRRRRRRPEAPTPP